MPFRKLSNKEVEEFDNRLSNYDGILIRSGIFTEKILGHLKATRIISVHDAVYDQIDVKAAQDLGIWVTNAPGDNANSVAELTIGLMVDLFRKISFSNIQIKTNGNWEKARKIGNELFHHRLGIIGYGNIGKLVAKLAQSFEMFVYVYDPYILKGINKNKRITYCDKDEQLLGLSDIVTLHIPLDVTTYHFVNIERLKKMKPGSFLINVSRGGIVDKKALYQELISGHLGGAALDLLE
jgi:D-3-phosphoglycerate dehydrogenase